MEEAPIASNEPNAWTSHLDYCDRGFRTTGKARVDLARLGALCGASNGLARVWTSEAAVRGLPSGDETQTDVRLRLAQGASGCGRFVFAFAAPAPAGALHVQVVGHNGTLAECQLSQSGFCPSNKLVCAPTHLKLLVAGAAGVGEPSRAATTIDEVLKVNVEWWALASIPALSRSRAVESSTEPLLWAE